ncbi:hypothetical protein BT93_F3414 [Corymbia citriodora subsp. variegata]|nr:hypothetical protein BT93_F3414 [Corymbia citriodora subsp. variegata]KAF8026917.1 hypothetical protein BT93_F3414 [Corymbia citriodora subsp. variegata]
MDDLERAIIVSFDQSGGVDSVLKSQAIVFCQHIKEAPTICRLCVEKLRFCQIVQVQFWCLQTLHEAIRAKYSSISSEEKDFIKKSVFSIACYDEDCGGLLAGPPFIKNKLAQVIVTLIYFEYPLIWPSVFVDFLPHLSKGGVVIDMFCRVLNALDDELISLDYPRRSEEVAVAGQVKDAMRQQCVPQIVRACYDILSMYRNSDSEICAAVLDTLRRYISWIDISLIANDVFLPFLFELMLFDGIPEQFRGAAAGCVLAVVSKRMDPQSKLSLLKNVQISRVFGLVSDNSDSELASRVASLLTGYAVEVLECSKRLTEETKGTSFELLDEVLPSVFYIMQNCEVDTAFSIVQFFSGYVSAMKSLSPLTEKRLYHVSQILEVIRSQIRYDPIYRDNLDTLDKIGKEEEDRMVEYRKDFFVLLRSIGRVAPDITQAFIRNSLDAAVTSSGGNIEEVEAALSLLYALGESLNEETIRSGKGLLSDLVPKLLASRFPCHSNRVVALVYLDTITRYAKFVQENTQYIPMLLTAFLDERGIHHPNINVSRRASYLFMRVVKSLKSNLVPFIETILQSLQDIVAQFTNVDYSLKALSASEDGSHIFEAIGILIGMEDVPVERQSGYLSSLLTPLCHQVEGLLLNSEILTIEEAPGKIATIQQVIMAINALSKGFSERLVTASRPGIGLMFKKTLDVLLQILVVYPKIEPLRSKVMSFIHRMVDTLGASVFPYLPKALEQLLAEIEPKEMASFLLLLNQIICKFNKLAHDVLEELFPAIAGRIFSIIIPMEAIASGPGANTEEIREIQELQQTLYTFLYDIATHDLSSVFLSPKSRHYLDQLMQLLLCTACNHQDILVRKVPGFQKFMIEGFATNCCLYSVLDRSFEFRDANTLILFGEIVLAQKIMYEKFGDDFLNFLSKGFLTMHCPQHLVEQYCQKLQGGDIKSLKSSYRSLIENLRLQQNGSLVFR